MPDLDYASVESDGTTPATVDAVPVVTEEPEKVLEVFREVPGFDPRVLVLKYGDDLLDLQFCSCVSKYKKKFSAFLNEFPDFLGLVNDTAETLASQGYKNVEIKDILSYLKTKVKLDTSFSEYMQKYSHDFDLDLIDRGYLIRKLVMTNPSLFSFFEISPIKCRSNCAYPSDTDVEEEKSETDIAGF